MIYKNHDKIEANKNNFYFYHSKLVLSSLIQTYTYHVMMPCILY